MSGLQCKKFQQYYPSLPDSKDLCFTFIAKYHFKWDGKFWNVDTQNFGLSAMKQYCRHMVNIDPNYSLYNFWWLSKRPSYSLDDLSNLHIFVSKIDSFKPEEWPASNFPIQLYCWIILKDHENKGNDRQTKKLCLLNKFSVSVPEVREEFREYRYWCKGVKCWANINFYTQKV